MKNQKKYTVSTIAISILLMVMIISCTDGFDQLNVNPNQPTQEDVPASTVLAAGFDVLTGQLYASRLGIFYVGMYAGYTVPIGIGEYEFRIDINNNIWNNLYRAAGVFTDAHQLAEARGNTNLAAVALTMKAFTAHHITDMWGDVPYSDSFLLLQGEDVRNPVFDSQQAVYNQILNELKEAADMLNNGTGSIGGGDLIFGGNVEKWRKFTNSLRLRVAMQMSNVAENEAKIVVNDVLSNPTTYPIINDNSDNAYMWWPGLDSDSERWFRTVGSLTGNKGSQLRLNHDLVNVLKVHNDPRLPVYADPNTVGEFNGYLLGPGQRINPDNTGARVSHIGDRFGNDPEGFSPFMNVAEVKFILAEIYERGLFSGDAQQAYETGVTLSMQENGITGADVTNYLNEEEISWGGGSTSNLHKIYLQNWIALFKNSVVGWTSVRRTDVPLLTNVSDDWAHHPRPPYRMSYPDIEQVVNSNFPIEIHARAQDTFYGFQLWFDTRNL